MSDIASTALCCCVKLVCCTTLWAMTIAVCIINTQFCAFVSISVMKTNTFAGIAFLIIFGLWNGSWILKSLCSWVDERAMKIVCWYSCSSVMVLLTVSFTLITRYYYYERSPRHPEDQFSVLERHKFGLICLVSGLPVMYGCNCRNLRKDKKMIYKVIVDFIDIYEMAEVLALGAPTCTPSHSDNTQYDNNINSFNNTFYNQSTNVSFNNTSFNNTIGGSGWYYKTQPVHLDCTESMYSALREGGWIEKTVQVLCSLSFLIFSIIYTEALKEEDEENGSLKTFFMITRLLQDIPFFVIRTLVWVLYGFENQFIFLVKNGVSASLTFLEFCKIDEQHPISPSLNQGQRRQQLHPQQLPTEIPSHRNPGYEA